jgi:hypothetical protein
MGEYGVGLMMGMLEEDIRLTGNRVAEGRGSLGLIYELTPPGSGREPAIVNGQAGRVRDLGGMRRNALKATVDPGAEE